MNRRHFALSSAALLGGIALTGTRPAIAQAGNVLADYLDPLAGKQFPGYSAALWHDGEAIAAWGGRLAIGGGPVREDAIFRIASVTKMITGAAALSLVEDGAIGLDDPVEAVLPELKGMKVLADIAGPLDAVVDADRPVTLRHLLSNTFGQGLVMQWPAEFPIQQAMAEAGISSGATFFDGSHDQYMAAMSSVPLAGQPGESFFYNNSFDVAGILIARLAGKTLGEVLAERILAPLGMESTGFVVPESERDRLAKLYMPDMATGVVAPLEHATLAQDDAIPFQSGAGGLSSTAGDLLRFGRMLLDGGELDGVRVLETASVDEMMRDQLTDALRASPHAAGVLGSGLTWGLGGSVSLGGGEMNLPPGAFGWNGGYGTSLFVDRGNGLVGVVLTNQVIMSAVPAEPLIGFWQAAYRSIGVDIA